MCSYKNPSSFLDGLGLRPEIEAPTAADREELARIVHDTVTYVMTDITSDFGPVADAIIANGWRKQKPK